MSKNEDFFFGKMYQRNKSTTLQLTDIESLAE